MDLTVKTQQQPAEPIFLIGLSPKLLIPASPRAIYNMRRIPCTPHGTSYIMVSMGTRFGRHWRQRWYSPSMSGAPLLGKWVSPPIQEGNHDRIFRPGGELLLHEHIPLCAQLSAPIGDPPLPSPQPKPTPSPKSRVYTNHLVMKPLI